MNIPKKSAFLLGAAFLNTAQANTPQNNIYFFGAADHLKGHAGQNNGNMDLFAYSRDYKKGNWNFENGAGTFVDSYHKRSYIAFSNISNDRIKTKYVQPVIGLNCMYKGKSYNSDEMQTVCSPPIKLRIGKQKGLFAYLTPVPKIKGVTNGFISLEVGYKF
jgi:hypothetical protein